MKISSMITGLILISMIVFAMSQYIVNVNENYDVNIDNTSLESYNKLEELNEIGLQTKDQVNEVTEP